MLNYALESIRLNITVITQILFHCVDKEKKHGDLLYICMSVHGL